MHTFDPMPPSDFRRLVALTALGIGACIAVGAMGGCANQTPAQVSDELTAAQEAFTIIKPVVDLALVASGVPAPAVAGLSAGETAAAAALAIAVKDVGAGDSASVTVVASAEAAVVALAGQMTSAGLQVPAGASVLLGQLTLLPLAGK